MLQQSLHIDLHVCKLILLVCAGQFDKLGLHKVECGLDLALLSEQGDTLFKLFVELF